jgi:Protein of unknown function (DUF 659)
MQRNSIPSTPDSIGSSASSSFNDSTPLWQYVTRVVERSENGGNVKFICNFCRATFSRSYFRVKAHLLQIPGHGVRICSKMTNEEVVRLKRLQDETEARAKTLVPKQVPLPSASSLNRDGESLPIPIGERGGKRRGLTAIEKSFDVATRNEIDEEISRAFYTGCPSFNFARNPHFIKSYQILSNSGVKGYKPPSYNKIRTTLLDRERVHVDRLLEPLKSTWTRKGVSIVCDGWTDVQRRPLINFIAITDGGPIFLKAINCQGEVKDKFFIFTIIKEVIEEVGPRNVVQVITDNAPVCKAAGMLIETQYPNIFWTPCVVHTLNLALKNICAAKNTEANQVIYDECSWINIIASDVFVIKNFINNHSMLLHMYLQCCDLKLLSAAETRFASVIIVLKRFFQVKRGLKELVIKECWNEYQHDNVDRANFIREKILDENGFWKKIEYILTFTEPIYEMLRVADTDKPCLHLVYEMWDNMIAKVKTSIYSYEGKREDEESSFFNVVCKILTDRWAKSNTPLHCLAHSLNPRYHFQTYISF